MNNSVKSLTLAVILLVAILAGVMFLPADGADSDQVTLNPTAEAGEQVNLSDLMDDYSNNRPNLELTINLDGSTDYIINATNSAMNDGVYGGSVGFYGKSLTISGPESGTKASVTVYGSQQINTNSSTGATFSISNVALKANDQDGSYSMLSMYHYKASSIEDCTADKVLVTLTSTDIEGSAVSARNCSFSVTEDTAAYTGYYALTLKGTILTADAVSITGYDRGINMEMPDSGSPEARVASCMFTGIPGKCALQFSEGVDGMPITVSGTKFENCAAAVSLHETLAGTGDLLSVDNTFTGCTADFLYAAGTATSSVTILSADDSFDDGAKVASESDDVPVPEDTITEVDWYDSDSTVFTIDDAEGLRQLAAIVNSGLDDFAGKTVVLTKNIDLTGYDWVPIGSAANPFDGIFDGNGHVVSNLTISRVDAPNDDLYLGLFGNVDGEVNGSFSKISDVYSDGKLDLTAVDAGNYTAVIRDLTLRDVNVTASGSFVSALMGCGTNVLVDGVVVESGVVKGTNSVGAIAGRGYDIVIIGCRTGSGLGVSTYDAATGSIYNIGGIAGALRSADPGGEEHPSAVIDSVNGASVTAFLSSGGAGGMVGHSDGSPLLIYGCTNDGDITVTGHGTVTYAYNAIAGGMVGLFQDDPDNVIASCVNNGNVITSEDVTTPVGALAGMANYYGGLVVDSVNNGNISGNAYYVAGIVGHGAEVIVDGCSNTGTITSEFALGGQPTGNNTSTGYASTICAGTAEATYRNMVFQDVDELEAALVKAAKGANTLIDSGAVLHLENVTVVDSSGTIDIPEFLSALTSDEHVADDISVGDRNAYVTSGASVYANTHLEIGLPDAAVALNGSIGSDAGHSGILALSSDGMSLTIGEGSSVGEVRLTSAVGMTVTNLGTIGRISAAEYDGTSDGTGVTVYNGSDTVAGVTVGNISSGLANMTVYNHGQIVRGDSDDWQYLLNVGKAGTTSGATFVLYNYSGASIIGGQTGGQNYMFYMPSAAEVTLYLYEGSSLVNTGNPIGEDMRRWFMYYGLDGVVQTSGSADKGVLTIYYADGVVKRPDSSGSSTYTTVDMTETLWRSVWVGQNDGDSQGNFVDITSEEMVDVTFSNGLQSGHDSIVVTILSGTSPTVPTFTSPGLDFMGWHITGENGVQTEWTPGTPISEDATIIAFWTPSNPNFSLTHVTNDDGTITVSASFIDNPDMEPIYKWDIMSGGQVVQSGTDPTMTFTIPENGAEVELTLSLSKPDGNTSSISGTGVTTRSIRIPAPVAETHTVTLTIDGLDDIVIEVIDGQTINTGMIDLQNGFHLDDGQDERLTQPVTSDLTLPLVVVLDSPSVSLDCDNGQGSVTVTVDSDHGFQDVRFSYLCGSETSEDGVFVISSDGEYTFTASAYYGTYASSSSVTISIFVDSSFGYADDGITVYHGSFLPGFDADGQTVIYESSEPKVVEVDADGKLSISIVDSETNVTITAYVSGTNLRDIFDITVLPSDGAVDPGLGENVLVTPVTDVGSVWDSMQSLGNLLPNTQISDWIYRDITSDSGRFTVPFSYFGEGIDETNYDGYMFYVVHIDGVVPELMDIETDMRGVHVVTESFSPFAFYAESVTGTKVMFDVDPEDAKVILKQDGAEIISFIGDRTIVLEPGEYAIEVSADGHRSIARQVIVGDDPILLIISLDKLVDVMFSLTPGDATATFIDDLDEKVTISNGEVVKMVVGTYTVTVSASGYVTEDFLFMVSEETVEFVATIDPYIPNPEPGPTPGGDDSYVTPPVVYVDKDGGSDAVGIIACAAAACAAAIIALFAIFEYRKR